jgi:hypothetical protein
LNLFSCFIYIHYFLADPSTGTSPCPSGSIADETGMYCCPDYCGQCGGDGCHLFPGGEYNCCWSTFKYSCHDEVAPCIISDDVPEPSNDASTCPDGSIMDETGKYCCPDYCGQCGGYGCHLFPGGEFNCCWSTFKYSCYDGVSPCVLSTVTSDSCTYVKLIFCFLIHY